MFKRISLVCLVLVGLGAILWLSRNYNVVKVKPTTTGPMQTATNSKRQTSDLPEGAEVPESPRHAAGEMEKDRLAKLARLEQAIRDQEAKVVEQRKMLATIIRTKGIIYKGTDSPPDPTYSISSDGNDSSAQPAPESDEQREQDKMRIESQINSLLKDDGDQLMAYAAGLDLPYNAIKGLYPQYLEEKGELETLKIQGLGSGHPTVMAQLNQLEAMKRQIDACIVILRNKLQAELDLTVNRMKVAALRKALARDEAIKRGRDAQD